MTEHNFVTQPGACLSMQGYRLVEMDPTPPLVTCAGCGGPAITWIRGESSGVERPGWEHGVGSSARETPWDVRLIYA